MDVQPEKQSIDKLFSGTVFYIDFYQRDYKWDETPVRRLLDDMFYPFSQAYSKYDSVEPTSDAIARHYPWYYMNTYVTNTVDGKIFVVDGQQRLTTLTLILIKLKHLSVKFNLQKTNWLEGKIVGHSANGINFWMNHTRHLKTLDELFKSDIDLEKIPTETGITAENIVKNYKVISKQLDAQLTNAHQVDTFILYFLLRLVIINLSVEQTDVPMVFEVINDRGVKLKPYEILKGKLLGQINKVDMEAGNFNELWEAQVNKINDGKEDEIDNFFRFYLKSKYASTRAQGQAFDGDYHRKMFSSSMNEKLKLDHNPVEVKQFLRYEFRYFTDLYSKIYQAAERYQPSLKEVYHNGLNDLESQSLVILAACSVDDPEEDVKVRKVAGELDRMFTLLQLQGSYDSNRMATEIYVIASQLINASIDAYRDIFNQSILSLLSDYHEDEIEDPFRYVLFKNASVATLNKRFTRYFFARVEQYLAQSTKSEMKHHLHNLVRNTGSVNGFHVEHILSRNEDNHKLFGNDEELFEQQRNRLGGILLLKGKDNISSGNELYENKLKSYANTLYWNETLREDSYKSKLDFRGFIDKEKLDFQPFSVFGPDELESRHKLLFSLANKIWS